MRPGVSKRRLFTHLGEQGGRRSVSGQGSIARNVGGEWCSILRRRDRSRDRRRRAASESRSDWWRGRYCAASVPPRWSDKPAYFSYLSKPPHRAFAHIGHARLGNARLVRCRRHGRNTGIINSRSARDNTPAEEFPGGCSLAGMGGVGCIQEGESARAACPTSDHPLRGLRNQASTKILCRYDHRGGHGALQPEAR